MQNPLRFHQFEAIKVLNIQYIHSNEAWRWSEQITLRGQAGRRTIPQHQVDKDLIWFRSQSLGGYLSITKWHPTEKQAFLLPSWYLIFSKDRQHDLSSRARRISSSGIWTDLNTALQRRPGFCVVTTRPHLLHPELIPVEEHIQQQRSSE